MAGHIDTGKKGEQLAEEYLKNLGFTILFKNWRYKKLEVDIIASRKEILHFVEVKTRTSLAFGQPEESISRKKITNLIDASEEFLIQFPEWKRMQFDILSVMLRRNCAPEFFYIEDVYE